MARMEVFCLGMAACAAVSTAQAQVSVDIAKITCQQFVSYKIADPKLIAIWLSGYYNGKRGNTVIDPQALEQNAAKVRDYCWSNADETVIRATEQALGVGG
ncbi:MAG TPA: HdeA/HdeB family chaperone [Xanthobacteraceae bacterium]